INVAHAFVDATGVPESFAELVWQQALDGVRGETSLDAWESRNLALGREPNAQPEEPRRRISSYAAKSRTFSTEAPAATNEPPQRIDEKERGLYVEAAF